MTLLKTLYCGAVGALLLCPSLFAKDAAIVPPAQQQGMIVDSSEIIVNTIMKSPIPVLVDFWAPWCGPCRMLKSTIDDIEKKYKDRISVQRLNVDDYQQLAQLFGVSGIPAIFVINKGKMVDNLIGMQPAERYESAIENALAANAAHVKKDSTDKKTDTIAAAKPPCDPKADTTSKNKSSKKSGKN